MRRSRKLGGEPGRCRCDHQSSCDGCRDHTAKLNREALQEHRLSSALIAHDKYASAASCESRRVLL
jgi:hypothetical protein